MPLTKSLEEQSFISQDIEQNENTLEAQKGTPNVPNTPEEKTDFSALSNFFVNASSIGQLTEIAASIWDQIGYNRTIAEINKQPGDYFLDYTVSTKIDLQDNKAFLESLLRRAEEVDEHKDSLAPQLNKNNLLIKVAELAKLLETGFD